MGFDLDFGSLSCHYQGPHSYIFSTTSSANLSLKSLWVLSAKNWHHHQLGSLLKVKCMIPFNLLKLLKKSFQSHYFCLYPPPVQAPQVGISDQIICEALPCFMILGLACFIQYDHLYITAYFSLCPPWSISLRSCTLPCAHLFCCFFAAQYSRVGLHCTLSIQTPDTTESTKISIPMSIPYDIF